MAGDPSRVRVTRPLTSFPEGFAAELARQGVRAQRRRGTGPAPGASQPLARCPRLGRLGAHAAGDGRLPGIQAIRRLRLWLSRKALGPLVEYLRDREVLSPAAQAPVNPPETLLARYRDYLMSERGLVASTAEGHVHYVRPSLAARAGGDGVHTAGLTPADVTSFVVGCRPIIDH